MTHLAADLAWMERALAQAKLARLHAPPNPAVGCVLVNADGHVIGEGHTQPPGQAHAEVMALRDAASRGISPAGCTAYVTLEPCSHTGRTGPCCEALIRAGVARVVASLQDPNPLVSGQGFARLRAAGVSVDVGLCATEAEQLNVGFFHRMRTGLPWVRLKAATSLDGVMALPNGQSQWITGPEARADGHLWRARACAILTGVGTVLADDPALNVRGVDTPRQPALAIVDSRLRTPPTAKVFETRRKVWLFGTSEAGARGFESLTIAGADVCMCQTRGGMIDLRAVLLHLAANHVNELHVEAGPKLNSSLFTDGLVNEVLLYLAPTLLGPGARVLEWPTIANISEGIALDQVSFVKIGNDIRMRGVVQRSDARR